MAGSAELAAKGRQSGDDVEPLAAVFVYAKLPAQNIARVRRFYTEKLGFQPYQDHHDHLYYEVAGVRFLIFPSTGAPSGTHDQIGFVVQDLEATVAGLRRAASRWRSTQAPATASWIADT